MDPRLRSVSHRSWGDTPDGTAWRLVRALPFLLAGLGIAFQLATPRELTGTPLFVSAPLIAAPLFTGWATALFGAFGLIAIVLLHRSMPVMPGSGAILGLVTEAATVVFVTAIAVLLNRVVRHSRERLATARSVAEAAQRAVLPTPPQRVDGLRLDARYEAAQEDTLIGGDLYAASASPHGVRLLIGDVRGKGLGAIETVSVLLGAFWEAVDREPELAAVMGSLERALSREGARRSGIDDLEGFATCALVEIPPGHEFVRVLNHGHPEPLLLADGGVTGLTPREFALPLGLGGVGSGPATADVWAFPPEAMLLLYTDGLSEARDGSGVMYEPADRLRGRAFSSPERLLTALVTDVRRHSDGGASDDMALLAVQRPSRPPPQRPARAGRPLRGQSL
ncbi:PP2C family protein-serine/threonine phosphatase [Streptomyces sp. NPDC026092]|uniref:PP2C family protein-serine/threonine phosphatase n=1 Tax=Streptomyces sp. NPDC026092 TaxID=3154797 RepID=UPI003401A3D8